MTDKQIIIDDQKNTIHRLQQECTEKTNVIIALGEQLKLKEQECEELKEILKDKTDEYNKLAINYDAYVSMANEQLDKLKADNDELKKIIERLDVPKHEVIDMDIALENEKLKAENERLERQNEAERKDNWSVRGQLGEAECLLCRYDRTLTEIKEIVYELTNEEYTDFIEYKQKQILQKISEVENEHNG